VSMKIKGFRPRDARRSVEMAKLSRNRQPLMIGRVRASLGIRKSLDFGISQEKQIGFHIS
jgi:hypothetical protein